MSIIPNQNKILQDKKTNRWLDQFCMSQLLGKLENIKVGFLQVYANDMIYEFGSSKCESKLHAIIRVHDMSAFTRIVFGGEPAAGKTYIDGLWSSDDLIEVLRIFTINREALFGFKHGIASLAKKFNHFVNIFLRNSITGSKRNIKAHYDIGNDLYQLFLDDKMMYSSAYFTHENQDLSSASEHKLKIICEKLNIQDFQGLRTIYISAN